MRTIPILLALAILAETAVAQTPTPTPAPPPPQAVITSPATSPAGVPLVLFADQSTASTLTWKLISPKGAIAIYDQGGRAGLLAVVRNPTPGLYRFVLIASGSPGGPFDFDFADVLIVEPGPAPGPTPPPVPPAPPTPTLPKGFVLTLVTDTTLPSYTSAVAAAKDSATLNGSPINLAVASLGGRATTVDARSSDFKTRALPASTATAPTIVIQAPTGEIIPSLTKTFASEADVLAFLKLQKGGN